MNEVEFKGHSALEAAQDEYGEFKLITIEVADRRSENCSQSFSIPLFGQAKEPPGLCPLGVQD